MKLRKKNLNLTMANNKINKHKQKPLFFFYSNLVSAEIICLPTLGHKDYMQQKGGKESMLSEL